MMDREILFKGFHECEEGVDRAFYNGEWHNGEWVYGKSILFLKENGGEYYMPKCDEKCKTIHLENGDIEEINCADYNTAFYIVAPETVCQYTELNDKNGKKIFDGDVVKITNPYDKSISYYISFKSSSFVVNQIGINFCTYLSEFYCGEYEIEIIGNKFENPELVTV